MRLPRLLLRGCAFLMLAGLLVGVPVAVFRLVGVPLPGATDLHDAWHDRRIDGDLVVRVGMAVFAVLWLWFAVTALAELWHVVAWRFGGPRARLAPLPPGPSGWVRGLVRFIAVSSVSATAAFGSLVPLARASIATTPSVAPAAATVATSTVAPRPAGLPTHFADGRETPYSLATALGRPELRDRIIEVNLGRPAPDGVAWQGGVFPAGMEVLLPEEQLVATALGPAHEVVAGDSYWRIADDHLSTIMRRDATPREVFDYTEDLVSFNHDLLGHRDPSLILPGELVVLTGTAEAPIDATQAQIDAVPVDVLPVDVVPVDVVPVDVTARPAHDVVAPDVRLLPPAVRPEAGDAPAPAEAPLPVEPG
ncbi:MAG: hypothetical protein WCC60_15605, partial [Ilumatobacteraceae bacterium]